MTPEQWQRVREVLADALVLSPEERSSFLDHACGTDRALRREVETFLSSSEEVRSGFLQSSEFRITLTPGARLGNYEVLRLVGSGGMGEVYRARDCQLDREVAIKVLPSFLPQDPDRLRRFEQEARAAAALNHPNILAVFQMGTYEGVPYLVSELLEGNNLRDQLARGPMPLRKAIDCGVQFARGMAAAHEKGIVHRDLKPENLFVTKDGRVKILDFGLAKLTKRQRVGDTSAPTSTKGTEPGVVMGTVGYMSPEQVSGKEADHRTDIFAFGAILYEMLTGKRAFQKSTAPETMTAILNEDPPSISKAVPSAPPSLVRIVHRCLEKNPDERFQSASDLGFALEALSDSGSASVSTISQPPARSKYLLPAVVSLLVITAAVTVRFWLRGPVPVTVPADWTQLTNLPDSVTQPALSPDGRMVAFIRGPSTFAGPGEIYVKMLPDGQPVQLTHDHLEKMSPQFSPDGGEIAYTTTDTAGHWDTWRVPILGGQPRLWLPNASGLIWAGKGNILFSEIRDNDIHMAIVKAGEDRAAERDVYVPPDARGMAHRSFPSPDGKSVLVVEMDRGAWLPCRLVPLDGSTPGKQVGPPGAPCTSAAWSPDGKWMYLNSGAAGRFHLWRQRFPDGRPLQLTSGPTEEEGIALAADGRSLITSVGLEESSVWVHDSNGDRQLSLEGYCFDPKFTPDGKKLCYRILDGTSVDNDPSELRVVDLESGRNDALLPGSFVTGGFGKGYAISPDSRKVVISVSDKQGMSRFWVAPLDGSAPPHEIPNTQGSQPMFGASGEIFFRSVEGSSAFAFGIHEDGTARRKVIEQPIAGLQGVSADGRWLVVKLYGKKGSNTVAFPIRGQDSGLVPLVLVAYPTDINLQWSPDGRRIFIPVNFPRVPVGTATHTYVIPLSHGQMFPRLPAGGLHSEEEFAALPGARLIRELDVAAGPGPDEYAFVRQTVQRNLFRIPLP